MITSRLFCRYGDRQAGHPLLAGRNCQSCPDEFCSARGDNHTIIRIWPTGQPPHEHEYHPLIRQVLNRGWFPGVHVHRQLLWHPVSARRRGDACIFFCHVYCSTFWRQCLHLFVMFVVLFFGGDTSIHLFLSLCNHDSLVLSFHNL